MTLLDWLRNLYYDWVWSRLFARSQHILKAMADEAREDYLAGRTEPLDPERL